ncbi:MAG: alkaline phosphatase family protein [Actinomycetota bacterium]|nr:alkaline phosphatase family protein [Actinomycetota bacterium]
MAPRLVILGWDSATFDVAAPLMEVGRLPALKAIVERGASAPLRSTWPPITDCAWTSAFTGCNPAKHGIFGSWYRAPGTYAIRYFSSRDRTAPALWELAPDRRFLVWNVPMTYPPSAVNGAMLAGYGAPPSARISEPAELQKDLADQWPLEDLLDRAPHGSLESFLSDLERGLAIQPAAMKWAADKIDAECVVCVWPHVDRAQHFFWQFRGTAHPLASAVDRIYEAMDRATQELIDAWPDADFLIVSDHGAGPLNGDVNVGAWLARNGHAVSARPPRASLAKIAWLLPPGVRKTAKRLAPGAARKTVEASLSQQLGPFDWSRTDAFVGFHGDLWLNLEGREQQGRVSHNAADDVLDEIAAGLLQIADPATGDRAFAAVHKRDSIYEGQQIDLAPDLMLDSWTKGYRVAPKREPDGPLVIPPLPLSGVKEAWSSDHRPIGIFAAAGPRIAHQRIDELALYDVCPTALALLEQGVPEGLDGTPATAAFDSAWLTSHPVSATEQPVSIEAGPAEYSEDEAAAVAAHLKDLGYIE